ncbi:flagellin [Spirochaetia bacterium]|nr:flagellin [Spirochaetia bacterium]
MIINHNLSAVYANRHLGVTDNHLKNDTSKLASGLRINAAGDDASDLAVSEKMRGQIRGLNRASANATDAISFIQTTEGYLQETQDIIQRIRELAVQSANGIYTESDRLNIQTEVSQLVDEIDRIASHAQFNGMNMMTGRFASDVWGGTITASMWFHVGANMDQQKQVFINTMTAAGLGLRAVGDTQSIVLENIEDANRAIKTLDQSLGVVSKQRADLGAYQNRLEKLVRGVDNGSENMQSAEARIRDADMASEMVNYIKDAILNRTETSMLAQANTSHVSVLNLLR